MTGRPSLSRRSFILGSSTLLGAAACGRPLLARAGPRADLVMRGGTLFDGGGGDGVESDVAITGGRITAVGRRLPETGSTEIDARGLAVAPGFIDIHSHGDGSIFLDPRVESVIRQGITTIVVGSDGSSRAPLPSGAATDDGDGFPTMRDLFAALDRLAPAVNVASMVGAGTVRALVIGQSGRAATREELDRMATLVRRALDEGACGVSSGLEYNPGAFASRDELIALCQPLRGRGLPYATHMRNEDERLLEAVEESIAIARGAGCALEISHLKASGRRNWHKAEPVIAILEEASRSGIAVGFDVYPYEAYATGLDLLFPLWTQDGGTDAFLARLADPAQEARIRAGVLEKVEGLLRGWDNVMIAGVRVDADRDAEGKRLGSHAAAKGIDPYDLAVALITRNRNEVSMVGFAMSEDIVARLLAHPLAVVCSDGGAFATSGPARRGHPHPRGLGAFPRVLGRYVRERRALSLGDAISKMTALPAARIGLRDRGRVQRGFAADLVVFDPARVADRATFSDPFQYPEGIRHVVVSGALALRDGERLEERAGRTLSPG